MSQPQFVHLRCHTEFSITDSVVRIPELIAAARQDGQGALAITDISNLFATVKFYAAALAAGIKPIIGADVWVENEAGKAYRVLLLVQNQDGYHCINRLLSQAWLHQQHQGRAVIQFEQLRNNQGLIALSGAQEGELGAALLSGRDVEAQRVLTAWQDLFPDRFYIEIQRAGLPDEAAYLCAALALAASQQVPLVATQPTQFITPQQFRAHEARVCIAEGELLSNPKRERRFTPQQYFKTQAEMLHLFADIPSALANSVALAQRCNLSLVLDEVQLPQLTVPVGLTEHDYFLQLAKQGLAQRLVQRFPDEAQRAAQAPSYETRLMFECQTILERNFASYFLIVADFINWAKQNGVPVGPGRGSGAGSLVAYSLGITNLDPLQYQLLFERFLNPERKSMPDFDIDFCQWGRGRVIEYVRDKYGAESVAQIATFGTMAAKGAIRDVGRVLEQRYSFCDELSNLIPRRPGVTLAEALAEEEVLRRRYEQEEEVRELIDLAQELEGLSRNVGMHAGGVLIAPKPLDYFCPRYRQSTDDSDGTIAQFDKDDIERVGLVKFDFLGLTTLTILDLCRKDIAQLHGTALDFDALPLDAPEVFRLLSHGEAIAVFQLESLGMRKLLRRMQPDTFEEIIALVALFRPGPMDLIPDFLARKKGEPFDYPDPRTEPILKETFGIMVYQEQVMQMAQILAGYSLGEADNLRRAMGKKDEAEMTRQRDGFCQRAISNGLAPAKAQEVFELINKFAGYGFNKSHAAAYALLAYQTAWLKHFHPAIFMAANLTLVMDDTDSVRVLINDARATCGLAVLPPDVNHSDYRFLPLPASKQIRYGLGAVKGLGKSVAQAIVEARADGMFIDMFDFCARVDLMCVKKRALEALVRAGAFDRLYPAGAMSRASLLASVDKVYEWGEAQAANRQQVSLFDALDAPQEDSALALESVENWSLLELLQHEKGALGFHFSGNLFQQYEREWRAQHATKLSELGDYQSQKIPIWVAGIVTDARQFAWRKGAAKKSSDESSQTRFMVTLDDGSAEIEFLLDEALAAHIEKEQFLALRGSVIRDRFTENLTLRKPEAFSLAQWRREQAQGLRLTCQHSDSLRLLQQCIKLHHDASGLPLIIEVQQTTQPQYQVRLDESWRVTPSDACLAAFTAHHFNPSLIYR